MHFELIVWYEAAKINKSDLNSLYFAIIVVNLIYFSPTPNTNTHTDTHQTRIKPAK